MCNCPAWLTGERCEAGLCGGYVDESPAFILSPNYDGIETYHDGTLFFALILYPMFIVSCYILVQFVLSYIFLIIQANMLNWTKSVYIYSLVKN